jgi:hypothetical protein
MQSCPFNDHGGRASGQAAVKETDGLYPDLRFGLSIPRVEVRRVVIVKVHADDNAKEAADLRHPVLAPYTV